MRPACAHPSGITARGSPFVAKQSLHSSDFGSGQRCCAVRVMDSYQHNYGIVAVTQVLSNKMCINGTISVTQPALVSTMLCKSKDIHTQVCWMCTSANTNYTGSDVHATSSDRL